VVAVSDVFAGGGESGDSGPAGVGNGELGNAGVGVGGGVGVSVGPASTTRGVGVDEGTGVGTNSDVPVGDAVSSPDPACSVGGSRVALGTIVTRGTGEPDGVGVDVAITVGLTSNVGESDIVGVGSFRAQAANVKKIIESQRTRFITPPNWIDSPVPTMTWRIPSSHERAYKPDSVPRPRSGRRPSI
jgi:hypothetical protein